MKRVQVHICEDGRYSSTFFEGNAGVPATVLPGLEIAIADIFGG